MATIKEMLTAVKNHAIIHYNQDGWDSVIEYFDDQDIEQEIKDCTTVEEAIATVAYTCKIWNNHQKDIEAESF